MAVILAVQRSSDARYLALSSQDGYCTLVEFENDELGAPILSGWLSDANYCRFLIAHLTF